MSEKRHLKFQSIYLLH